MNKKYVLESSRLRFRTWIPDDIPAYARLSSDPDVMQYFPKAFWLDEEKAEHSVMGFMQHFDDKGFTYYATERKDSNEFIGFIGMKSISYEVFFAPAVDIGWRLAKEHWGRGFATEGAIATMLHFFENFNYDKLVSMTPVSNQPSWNVMRKIGMKKLENFDHPLLEPNDELLEHVLYVKENPRFEI